jgi:TatD DNase family protein
MKMFSECHCHLRGNVDEIIENAKKHKIELILVAGIDIPSSENAVKIAEKFDIVKGCVGIHPWRADTYSQSAMEKLRKLSESTEVVAISEIGLDYAGRRTVDMEYTEEYVKPEIQVKAFQDQIRLAKEFSLPILVHDRTLENEVLDIIQKEENNKIETAIHGFNKSIEYAKKCVEREIYLSIGKRPIGSGDEAFFEAIKHIPIRWLLTETDSGDPTGVIHVAEKIAKLKGIKIEKVGISTTENLKRLICLK